MFRRGFFLFLWALVPSVWGQVPASTEAVSASAPGQASFEAPASTSTALLPGMTPSTGTVSVSTAAASEAGSQDQAEAVAAYKGPWAVGEVQFQGLRHVKPKVVRGLIRAKKGEAYGSSDINQDVQAIMKLGSFERVTVDISTLTAVSTGPVRVTYVLEERPILRKIVFEGNKQFSKSKLSDTMSLKAKDPMDEVKLREDLEKLEELYREDGYMDVRVEYKTVLDTAAHQVDLNLSLREGPKSRIVAVEVAPVTAFKVKKILRQMKTRRKKVFSPKQFEEDLKTLTQFYKNRGYADFEILKTSVTYSADKTKIFVVIDIREGNEYRFGDTYFDGNTVYKSTELAKAVIYRKGKIFNQEKFEETIRAVQEMYADKGRLRTVVDYERKFNEKTKLLDIYFGIQEGDVVTVDHIDVEGNKATKTYVLKREIVLKEGEIFSASKIRKSQQKIMNLQFIDDIQLDIQSTADPNRVDLVFNVTEGKPGMLTAGAGYSSIDGLVGSLSLAHLNLFGRAQRANVQWQFGKRVQDYSVSWTTPWVMNKPTSLGFDVFNTKRARPFSSFQTGFQDERTGGSIRVGPRFQDDKYTTLFSYTFQRVKVADVSSSLLGSLSTGTQITSSLFAEFARDTRDSVWDPTQGSRHSISFQLTGGPLQGDVNSYKPGITNNFNWTTIRLGDYPLVLAVSNRFGWVKPFGSTGQVPVYDRFFMGGQDTVRGYDISGQVGPPLGGTVFDVLNVEYKFPLAREKRRTIVQGAVFFDMGNAWESFSDVRLKVGTPSHYMKTSVGFGIRFTTPAFPIRLDWGYGLNHRPGEQRGQVHFALGNIAF